MLSQSSVIPNISPNSSFTEEDRSSDSDEVYITNWLKCVFTKLQLCVTGEKGS